MCFNVLYIFRLEHFSSEEFSEVLSVSYMYIGIHVKYLLFLSDLNGLEFYWKLFKKCTNIIFHKNGLEFYWKLFKKCTNIIFHKNGLEFYWKLFKKCTNIIFHKNPSIGSRVFPCGRSNGQKDRETDRNDDANSHFSQICECGKQLGS